MPPEGDGTPKPEPSVDELVSADTQVAAPGTEPSQPNLPPREVLGGRYEVLAELGRGAEGAVYRVRDLTADAVVALKLLPQDDASDLRRQRFRRELQMARKITHPNVVRIHDIVELPGRFGLTMELVDGETLTARIARGRLARDEVVALALDLGRALAAAHEAGVLHRDLKPGNILFRRKDGRAVVTDFGVSRALERDDGQAPTSGSESTPLRITLEGAIIGTPQYMAPEQLDGRLDVGPAADVYAFGLVLIEAATGERPHEGAKTLGELRRLRTSPAPSLREARPDLPARLCDAVDRALANDPARRFRDGAQLLAALEGLDGLDAARTRARRAWAAAGGIAAVAAVAGIAALRASATREGAPAVAPSASAAGPGDGAAAAATRPLALALVNPRRLTMGDGCEEFPSLTPDGRAVLYDATSSIVMLPLDGGPPKKLTYAPGGYDLSPAVSPRGDRFAFYRVVGPERQVMIAPLDGSAPPRALADGTFRPSWSRDGTAVWTGEGQQLQKLDADGGGVLAEVRLPTVSRSTRTAELADGSLMVMSSATMVSPIGTLRRVPPGGGEARVLYEGDLDELLVVTPDGRHALVGRNLSPFSSLDLFDVPVDGSPGASLALPAVTLGKGLVLSSDGKKVAWSSCNPAGEVAAIDAAGKVQSRSGTDDGSPNWLAAAARDARGVVCSYRGGPAHAWVIDLSDAAPPHELDAGSGECATAAISNDGRLAAVAVGGKGIRVGSTSDAAPLRAVTDGAGDLGPAFRFGDAQILFTRTGSDGTKRVMAAPVGGGDATPLLDADSELPAASPVDDRIAYVAHTGGKGVVTIWDGRTGARRVLSSKLAPSHYSGLAWSPDARRIAISEGGKVLEVDVAGGAVLRTIETPTLDTLSSPAYGPAGLLVVRTRWKGNLWIADVSL